MSTDDIQRQLSKDGLVTATGQNLVTPLPVQAAIAQARQPELPSLELFAKPPGRIRVDVEVKAAVPLRIPNTDFPKGALDVEIKPLGLTLCGLVLTWDGYAVQVSMPRRPKKNNDVFKEETAVWGNVANKDIFLMNVLRDTCRFLQTMLPPQQFEQYFNLPPLFWQIPISWCIRRADASPFQSIFSPISSGYEEERSHVLSAIHQANRAVSVQTRDEQARRHLNTFLPAAVPQWK